MSARRREDSRFLTGGGSFVANSNLDQQAYAKVVRSPHGHAYIKSINISIWLYKAFIRNIQA